MQIPILYAKIHRATVTDSQLHYQGSLSIDRALMDLAGIIPYQQIQVYNIATGSRFETYAIEAPAHSGTIQVNGAAAHLAKTGDLIIIAAYAQMDPTEAAEWEPNRVYVDRDNRPCSIVPDCLPV